MSVDNFPRQHSSIFTLVENQLGHHLSLVNRSQLATCRTPLTINPRDNDLSHDRSGRCHLGPDVCWQDSFECRQSLLNGLSRGTNLRFPIELDIDDIQAGSRLTTNRLHSVRAKQCNFNRLCDKCFHFLGC
ncbi:hypothetical protein Poly41_40040 [Novipirellula artificiosorum]|uniref:Uncharacterized protein n=1 Tax=Novipirellula artificiosorum TaxID=2528016 RepID=A0A5C6DGL6_9BACT|nr:hypothetical protein Poly41_40040 [Novipirellula artificiosorum]